MVSYLIYIKKKDFGQSGFIINGTINKGAGGVGEIIHIFFIDKLETITYKTKKK